MRLAVPPEVQVEVMGVQPAAAALKQDEWIRKRVLLLMPSLREARRLVEAGAVFDSLNVGGLHDAPARTFLTPSLALGPQDWEDIEVLLKKNISIETRALPADERRPVEEYRGRPSSGQGIS
jgi:mannose/fructose/N-acetylgalactosamine-specific phosphotransferase system component IIB